MINITARGFDLKQGTKDGIDKELQRIEKMLPDNASFDVTLAKVKDGYKCDITVKYIGSFIRGEARADKTYLVDKKRKGGIDQIASMLEPIEEVTMDDFESYDSSAVDIQRKKNIQLQMMTDDEAIVQMEMLGHSFFVYLAPNGQTCVIYKRGKGYGQLICS